MTPTEKAALKMCVEALKSLTAPSPVEKPINDYRDRVLNARSAITAAEAVLEGK